MSASITFSGMVGGSSDLFVYHLDEERLERLTNDLYAQLQPAWSPDGRRIAYTVWSYQAQFWTLAPSR